MHSLRANIWDYPFGNAAFFDEDFEDDHAEIREEMERRQSRKIHKKRHQKRSKKKGNKKPKTENETAAAPVAGLDTASSGQNEEETAMDCDPV